MRWERAMLQRRMNESLVTNWRPEAQSKQKLYQKDEKFVSTSGPTESSRSNHLSLISKPEFRPGANLSTVHPTVKLR